jgi:hypothetical protein
LLIQHQVVGIASSINWFCACRWRGGGIKARLRVDNVDEARVWNELTYARLKRALILI